jgi:hypothetical protein
MLTDPSKKDDALSNHPEKSVGPVANDARRRFTKASLVVSGVLMTLPSRSVLAAEAVSLSGFSSVNQSRHGLRQESRCRRPYYWAGDCSWPCDKEVLFSHIFNQCPPHSLYHQQTCQNIVSGNFHYDTTANQRLGQYLVAAYLNACSGYSAEFLSPDVCINVGNEWITKGHFSPTANVTWNTAQLVQYFENTQF